MSSKICDTMMPGLEVHRTNLTEGMILFGIIEPGPDFSEQN
jgi:hypothetical protein